MALHLFSGDGDKICFNQIAFIARAIYHLDFKPGLLYSSIAKEKQTWKFNIQLALNRHLRIRWREGQLGAAAEDFTDSRHRARLAGRPALAALGATHLADLALLRGDSAEAIALAEMAVTEYRSGGDEALAGLTAARLATLYADAKRWRGWPTATCRRRRSCVPCAASTRRAWP